jgi:glycine cleavage system H lipoate-binding protein
MYDIPADLRYSKDHLWVRVDAGTSLVRAGVTDFAQQSLGDVVDVSPPRPNEKVKAGEPCGDIESTKSSLAHPTSSMPIPTVGAGCSTSKSTRRRWPSSLRLCWMPAPIET